MPRHIIIDGYNLLFAIGKAFHPSDRAYLLKILATYKRKKNVTLTVVFDRKTGNPLEGKEYQLHEGVHIVYTSPGQEADEVIRQMVDVAKNPKEILVVSSDKAGVSIYSRKVGAEIIESRDFYSFLMRSKGASGASNVFQEAQEEEKPQVRKEDIEYYLDKFTKKKLD